MDLACTVIRVIPFEPCTSKLPDNILLGGGSNRSVILKEKVKLPVFFPCEKKYLAAMGRRIIIWFHSQHRNFLHTS